MDPLPSSPVPCMAVCMQCSSIGRVRDLAMAPAMQLASPVFECLPACRLQVCCALVPCSSRQSNPVNEGEVSIDQDGGGGPEELPPKRSMGTSAFSWAGPGRRSVLAAAFALLYVDRCACVAISNRTADARKRPGHPSSRAPCCLPLPLFFPYAPPTLQAAACTSGCNWHPASASGPT